MMHCAKKPAMLAIFALIMMMVILAPTASARAVQFSPGEPRIVRIIEEGESGLIDPAGMAYLPAADALVSFSGLKNGNGANAPHIALIDRFLGRSEGQITFNGRLSDQLALAYDQRNDSLYLLDQNNPALFKVGGFSEAISSSAVDAIQADLGSLGRSQIRGIAMDDHGDLILFNPSGSRLVRIPQSALNNMDSQKLSNAKGLKSIELKSLAADQSSHVAFNPENNRLYFLDTMTSTLEEIDDAGNLTASYDLSMLEVGDIVGLTFAPSGDQTDDPSRYNLYLADSGLNLEADGTSGSRIFEIELSSQAFMPLALNQVATLTQLIDTSKWSPPSPDPAGIDYRNTTDSLFVGDSEVDEMNIYAGVNVFETTRNGTLLKTGNTLHFSDEPTGAAYNPTNGHLFFSDDGGDRYIFEVTVGTTGDYDAGDPVTTTAVSSYGIGDPEGVAYGDGHLFISDGEGQEIWVFNLGPDGLFGTNDDSLVRHFDTSVYGIRDPEGIDYVDGVGSLVVVSRNDDFGIEVSTTGELLQTIDYTALNIIGPAGVAYAPSSDNSGAYSLYIVDRGIDNGANPNENDGKIYEVSFSPSAPPNPPPTVSIISPVNGSTVSGDVPIRISAADAEESVGSLRVEWSIDGTAWQGVTYNGASGYYEGIWDTTGVADGSRVVNARAIDSQGGTGTATTSALVDNVNDLPVASFTYNCTGMTCDFNASSSSDPDGSVVAYSWNFGDNNTGSGQTPNHLYGTPGSYTVTLTVTDNRGGIGAITQSVPVGLSMHVGDLDGTSTPLARDRWLATVVISIHDANGNPVAQADVSGSWSAGTTGGVSCTTDSSGRCSVEKSNLKPTVSSVTLTINSVSHSTLTYQASANDDPDGDSDGTSIVVYKDGAPNNAPQATADSFVTNEDTLLSVPAPGVLDNDVDSDGQALSAILVSGPANGSLALNADGSFTYTPNMNKNGTDSFTYRANDGQANSNVVAVTITVVPVNDAPVANNDFYVMEAGTTLSVPANGVLANDSDVDGNSLTSVLGTNVGHGALTLNANGSFDYTPDAGYIGGDSFTYRANDGALNSEIATVTITVNAVNHAPVAIGDSYSTGEDTLLSVTTPGVLFNDTDADGNALSAVLVSNPANGSLTLSSDGSFTYMPDPNFNGTDSFTYKANDTLEDSNVATVSITVNAINDAPIASDDSYSADVDTALSEAAPGVLGNDSDVDGGTLTATLVGQPNNGSLALNADGSFNYTPNAGFVGIDTFTYVANDGSANSDPATVTIEVRAVTEVIVTGISPDTMAAGSTLPVVTINGSGFLPGANVTFEGGAGPAPEITVTNVASDGASLTVSITAKSGGPPRERVWSVRVTNPDGSTGALIGGFTITP